jgi:hypothetical protein
MKLRRLFFVLAAGVFLLGISFNLYSGDAIQKVTPDKFIQKVYPDKQFPKVAVQIPEFAKSRDLIKLRGAEAASLLGKQVDVAGFFYEGSIPMIVDDIRRVLVNMVMPPDSYVPIIGPRPKGVKNGDRISMKMAKLDRPTPADHKAFQREGTIVRVANDTLVTILQPSTYQFSILDKFPYQIIPGVIQLPKYYAVLIAGGWDAANNHVRYWNDLKAMYNILRNAGYPAANIYVLYADGVARDGSMPVNGEANVANISNVFTQLSGKMKSGDTLYIMTNDHGSPNALCLWNHTTISAAAFAAEVNKIANYDKMIVQMEQCYSGSFVQPLAGPRRIIMSACAVNEVSYARISLQYNEFTFWYFAALTGAKPDGSGPVNADANGNGKVSIIEAFNFARANDSAPEHPQFDENVYLP